MKTLKWVQPTGGRLCEFMDDGLYPLRLTLAVGLPKAPDCSGAFGYGYL